MFKLTMQVNTPQSSVLFCFGISYSNAIQVCVHIANYSDTFEYYNLETTVSKLKIFHLDISLIESP